MKLESSMNELVHTAELSSRLALRWLSAFGQPFWLTLLVDRSKVSTQHGRGSSLRYLPH